jgi:hypothetical protein
MTSRDPEDLPPGAPPPFAPPRRPVFTTDIEPAPVVTDEGTFGHIPDPVALPDEDHEGWARPLFARLAAWLLVLVAAAWLVVLGGWQVTGRTVAAPALERAVGALGEIDALLTMHHDAIVAAGAQHAADPAARIAIPGFPVPAATLTALEARDGSTATLRALVLGRAADAIYAHGTEALVGPDGTPSHAAIFSTAGATRRLFAALTAANHDRLAALLWPLGLASAALAAAVLVLGRGFGRFVALGAALLGAAALTLAGTLVVRAGVAVVGTDGSALATEISDVTKTLLWTPVRDAAWLALAGVAVALPAMIAGLVAARREAAAEARAEADALPWPEVGTRFER